MAPAERLRQLPGYLAFNSGVMFFIGLASKLTSEGEGATLGAGQLRVMGFAVLLAVLAMAAGFASVARVEFAKREGKRFSLVWIAPSVAIGLPLGRAVGAGGLTQAALIAAGAGALAALLGMTWLALRARQEIKA
ncbi:hypothetical protein LJR225_001038 [Phenylobacterium sp. LjRoot225]|uniref:hypothetical protein n=1 Tax=Phenylobacterium sp. LjRoot225 TaxID=3342285 RepID=UPI003ECCEF2B